MRQYAVLYNKRTDDYAVIFRDLNDSDSRGNPSWSVEQDGLSGDFAEEFVNNATIANLHRD